MNIGKKAILLTAAAGSLVIGGAGGALAHSSDDLTVQLNKCGTAVGPTTHTSLGAPTGDLNIGSDCLNFTNSRGTVVQSNDCDTSTGLTLHTGGLAPTGDTNIGSKCANIAVDEDNNSHRR
ncbi:hypothetical protein [Streptomyces hygroscopicus]|uniref:hypothetical protein n=1 Tax=Streptomyces hygroscopicus TaxID=1912 RepID=UPI0007672677|nr:hypothetical protein [Streptomyces hygroscopicus]GLV78602.1 hypothetical protein Shyhy02_66020 [Streptomyces hygroscopicus subsp. hygroscopicus]